MWKGKKYSGRPTMKNGLKFESSTSLSSALDSHQMFEVKGDLIYFENQNVGQIVSQNKIYKWLESENIDWKKLTNKQMKPDEAVFNTMNNTLYIIEKNIKKPRVLSMKSFKLFGSKYGFMKRLQKI